MDELEINRNLPEDRESMILISIKPYHTPQLTEWGDVQELTRGGGPDNFDDFDFTYQTSGVIHTGPQPPSHP
jgi:hypothetical protein